MPREGENKPVSKTATRDPQNKRLEASWGPISTIGSSCHGKMLWPWALLLLCVRSDAQGIQNPLRQLHLDQDQAILELQGSEHKMDDVDPFFWVGPMGPKNTKTCVLRLVMFPWSSTILNGEMTQWTAFRLGVEKIHCNACSILEWPEGILKVMGLHSRKSDRTLVIPYLSIPSPEGCCHVKAPGGSLPETAWVGSAWRFTHCLVFIPDALFIICWSLEAAATRTTCNSTTIDHRSSSILINHHHNHHHHHHQQQQQRQHNPPRPSPSPSSPPHNFYNASQLWLRIKQLLAEDAALEGTKDWWRRGLALRAWNVQVLIWFDMENMADLYQCLGPVSTGGSMWRSY